VAMMMMMSGQTRFSVCNAPRIIHAT
jgi:hypothetical protein